MTRRWQDSDVRNRPDLRTLAGDYLTNYTGDFPYLVEARQALASGNTLRVSVVRGVLNCMMGDSSVVNMPEPTGSSFDAGASLGEERPISRPQTPIPQTIYLRSRFRLLWGVINSKQSKAIHRVDRVHSGAKMSTSGGAIRWQLGWACKSRAIYFSPIKGQVFLLNESQVSTTLRLGCLTMSPKQFGGIEMKGGLVRDWRECRQCRLLDSQSSPNEWRRIT